jgi:hypothetical protein
MSRLLTPTLIGDILSRDPVVLARIVLLAAEVRVAQKSYFALRSSEGALGLLHASKALERKLDLAIDAVCKRDLLS